MVASLNVYFSDLGASRVLGSQLLLFYIDELHKSFFKLFADNIALYKEIVSPADCDLFQEDLYLKSIKLIVSSLAIKIKCPQV